MSKKIRPSLKDYLRTGIVRTEDSIQEKETQEKYQQETIADIKTEEKSEEKFIQQKTEAPKAKKTPEKVSATDLKAEPVNNISETSDAGTAEVKIEPPSFSSENFIGLLSERDRQTWQSIVMAGTELQVSAFSSEPLREKFLKSDKNRFTFYLLEKHGAPLVAVRNAEQIKEPLEFLMKWDEVGVITLYIP